MRIMISAASVFAIIVAILSISFMDSAGALPPLSNIEGQSRAVAVTPGFTPIRAPDEEWQTCYKYCSDRYTGETLNGCQEGCAIAGQVMCN